MSLDSKIIHNISLGAPAVSRQGFGTPLILGAATFAPRVKFFESGDDWDGDAELTSGIKKALTTAFAQSPAPTRVAVGRREANVAQVVKFVFTFNPALAGIGDYTITINSTDYTHTTSDTDLSSILTALAGLVDADPDVSALESGGDTITVTARTAGKAFSFASSVPIAATVTSSIITENITGLISSLTACKNESLDWYGFCLETRDESDILNAAAWAEANGRLFFAQSDDSDMLDAGSSDVASQLKALSYKNTAVCYFSDNGDAFDMGYLAAFLAHSFDEKAPTACYLTVAGVAPDVDDTTAQANLEAKNANYYSTLKGLPATFGGTVADGHDIEHVVTGEWAKARIDEAIALRFKNAADSGRRIPFNDLGFGIIEQAATDILKLGEDLGHFTRGTARVKMPLRRDVPLGDAQAGLLRWEWGAEYSGTVKGVSITGYVSLDFAGFNGD